MRKSINLVKLKATTEKLLKHTEFSEVTATEHWKIKSAFQPKPPKKHTVIMTSQNIGNN